MVHWAKEVKALAIGLRLANENGIQKNQVEKDHILLLHLMEKIVQIAGAVTYSENINSFGYRTIEDQVMWKSSNPPNPHSFIAGVTCFPDTSDFRMIQQEF
jgi:hypothetical protein